MTEDFPEMGVDKDHLGTVDADRNIGHPIIA
jgi:hypothetical protein